MFRLRDRGLALVVVLTACGMTGCVERRYTIRSDPPGALAIVNDQEVGPTPVSSGFTYYGDRKVTLIADGYQSQTFIAPVRRPWFDNYLTEFVTENVWPWTIRDERDLYFKLQPTTVPGPDQVTANAEMYRQQGQAAPVRNRRGWFSWLGF